MATRGKLNAIWWNIKINLQKLVDICGYELPTNLQNFRQKSSTEVKIFKKSFTGGATFLKHRYKWVTADTWRLTQSKGPLYRDTVMIGTGRWWVDCYIWYSEEGPGRAVALPSPILVVPNVIAYPSTSSVSTSYYLMWHYNYLCTLKG